MDLHTLHVEHAILLGLFGLLTLVNFSLHRRRPGSGWFAAFTCLLFGGAVLVALRTALPLAVSIVGGAGLFAVAYVLLQRAMVLYFEQEDAAPQQVAQVAQVALGLLALGLLLQWGVVQPNTARRLLGYSLVLSAQTGLLAWFVLRQRSRGPVLWASRVMGGLLLGLAANNLLRAAAVLLQGAPTDYLQGGASLSQTVLVTSVLQGGVVIAWVWMTAASLLEQMEHEAMVDPLTGVLNRRAIGVRAAREIARGQAAGEPTSAVLIDLDHFKAINDRWGHHSGDAVLRAVASRLEAQLRPGDALARLGGDEFAVLLPRTGAAEATQVAAQMRQYLEELRCGTDPEAAAEPISVRASFGTATCRDGCSWEEMLRRCDGALYAVKDLGGNGVRSAERLVGARSSAIPDR